MLTACVIAPVVLLVSETAFLALAILAGVLLLR